MRATISWLGALLAPALLAPAAHAQYSSRPIPQAPDACGPGYYAANCCGLIYGPNYCLRPPCAPFQGMVPCPPGPPAGQAAPGAPPGVPGVACAPGYPGAPAGPGGPCGPVGFPTHPFARSPRDYFMASPTDYFGGPRDFYTGF